MRARSSEWLLGCSCRRGSAAYLPRVTCPTQWNDSEFYQQRSRRCSTTASARSDSFHVHPDELRAVARRILEEKELAEQLASRSEVAGLVHEARKHKDNTQNEAETMDMLKDRLVSDAPAPTSRQLKIYGLQHLIPFIGFGFFDNAIMLIFGDLVDAKLGVSLGISTLAAAGMGNLVSDVFGLWISGLIETAGAAMGLPEHGLTNEQQLDLRVRILKNTSMIVGISVGCILGMFPLAYPKEWRLWEPRIDLEIRDVGSYDPDRLFFDNED